MQLELLPVPTPAGGIFQKDSVHVIQIQIHKYSTQYKKTQYTCATDKHT